MSDTFRPPLLRSIDRFVSVWPVAIHTRTAGEMGIIGARKWFNATLGFQVPDNSRSAYSEACGLFRASRSR